MAILQLAADRLLPGIHCCISDAPAPDETPAHRGAGEDSDAGVHARSSARTARPATAADQQWPRYDPIRDASSRDRPGVTVIDLNGCGTVIARHAAATRQPANDRSRRSCDRCDHPTSAFRSAGGKDRPPDRPSPWPRMCGSIRWIALTVVLTTKSASDVDCNADLSSCASERSLRRRLRSAARWPCGGRYPLQCPSGWHRLPAAAMSHQAVHQRDSQRDCSFAR